MVSEAATPPKKYQSRDTILNAQGLERQIAERIGQRPDWIESMFILANHVALKPNQGATIELGWRSGLKQCIDAVCDHAARGGQAFSDEERRKLYRRKPVAGFADALIDAFEIDDESRLASMLIRAEEKLTGVKSAEANAARPITEIKPDRDPHSGANEPDEGQEFWAETIGKGSQTAPSFSARARTAAARAYPSTSLPDRSGVSPYLDVHGLAKCVREGYQDDRPPSTYFRK